MDADEEDRERARLLAEMRAYGPATPIVKHAQTGRRRNAYDEAAGEWLRSRTFKTILAITCLLAFLIFCVPALATLIGGYAALEAIRRLLTGGW